MPDAILRGPSLEHDRRFSALLDCKAAGEGYLMSKADERALVDYVHDFRVEAVPDTPICSARRRSRRKPARGSLTYARAICSFLR